MNHFLGAFSDELTKLSETLKNPLAPAQTKMKNLLKGGVEKYMGSKEVRTSPYPSMRDVATQSSKDKNPSLSFRPPKA